eukprot:Colp12_sorted_trinity150504_noHs@17941
MSLDEKQVEKAVKALMKHIENASKTEGKAQLFEEESFIWLQIGLKKIPDTPKRPYKIEIPNTLYAVGQTEACLFTKDPQKEYKALLQAQNVKGINKVIGVTKLKNKYKVYEQKRQLCGSYDIFLADERIIPLLPRLIGKSFFQKKREPIPVDLTKKNLALELSKARDATYLYLGRGPCSSVKIALTTHTPKQVVENITTGVANLVQRIPKKWGNIQTIHIKTNDSVALPIYTSIPAAEKTETTA